MSRAERVGRNENLFREINARIGELTDSFGIGDEGQLHIVCECGQTSCFEQIDVPIPEYAKTREDATRFLLKPGHEMPEFERVVEDRGDYCVVEKLPGEPAEVAREGSPS